MARLAVVVAAVVALATASCGRVGLDRTAEGAPDAGTGLDAPAETAPPSPPLPPFATIIRVINVGTADFVLDGQAVTTCPYGFGIQGGEPVDQPTALEQPDFSCDCDTCAATDGRPRCTVTDFLCQDPPIVLRPGAHFDFPWGGSVQAWQSPPPAGSPCAASCTAVVPVPAGSYLFTLAHWPSGFTVQSALPAPGGVVEIPVTAAAP